MHIHAERHVSLVYWCLLFCFRYGAAILQDLALLSLEDPANPGQLKLGNVAPVDFHEVARKEHKWQVLAVALFLSISP